MINNINKKYLLLVIVFFVGVFMSSFYIFKNPKSNSQPTTNIKSVTIQNAFFDEGCNVKINLNTEKTTTIPTDHQYSDKSLKCTQVKYIQTSPDNKFVAFEGSSWDNNSWSKGNYLVVYSAEKDDFFIVISYGAAGLQKLTFDSENNLYYEIAYEGDPFVLSDSFSIKNAMENFDINVNPTTKEYIPYIANEPGVTTTEPVMGTLGEKITTQGVIKKEKIPLDLELGDYWYWFYFEEPYILETNSSGNPLLINKIQIVAGSKYDNADQMLDEYLGKKLKIYGELSWGYAESRIIVLDSAEVL